MLNLPRLFAPTALADRSRTWRNPTSARPAGRALPIPGAEQHRPQRPSERLQCPPAQGSASPPDSCREARRPRRRCRHDRRQSDNERRARAIQSAVPSSSAVTSAKCAHMRACVRGSSQSVRRSSAGRSIVTAARAEASSAAPGGSCRTAVLMPVSSMERDRPRIGYDLAK